MTSPTRGCRTTPASCPQNLRSGSSRKTGSRQIGKSPTSSAQNDIPHGGIGTYVRLGPNLGDYKVGLTRWLRPSALARMGEPNSVSRGQPALPPRHKLGGCCAVRATASRAIPTHCPGCHSIRPTKYTMVRSRDAIRGSETGNTETTSEVCRSTYLRIDGGGCPTYRYVARTHEASGLLTKPAQDSIRTRVLGQHEKENARCGISPGYCRRTSSWGC